MQPGASAYPVLNAVFLLWPAGVGSSLFRIKRKKGNRMRKIGKDVLFGFLIVVVITILEFLVTLPFGIPVNFESERYSFIVNRELLLTALPALLVTYTFTALLKTNNRADVMRRSVIWTVIVFLNYLLIGIGNGNFGIIFSTIGMYVLLAAAFSGPLIYSGFKHLA